MTIELPTLGGVFRYPYLWTHQRDKNLDHPKLRPACMMFEIARPGGDAMIAIVAISDLRNPDSGACIEIPETEKLRAGLDEFRKAYVHLNEYNIDRKHASSTFNSRLPVLGRFSKPFFIKLSQALAANIRMSRATRIDRI